MKEYFVNEIKYSKKISSCKSGAIVGKKEDKFFILNYPEMNDNDIKLFENSMKEIRYLKTKIEKKADIYFFLKNYCIENCILLKKEPREKILTLLEWETMGESVLTLLLQDPDFEEIVINGNNKPIIVYHNIFGWLTTNIGFSNEEKIKTIINKMVSKLGRQLSYNTPLLNATLEDGSRINATMNPVAFSGINATIRKFKENPLTPTDIISSEVINFEAMAFLWLAVNSSCSILICGNTGSGKTTTLNSLFCFLPKEERIIVVEETPEVVLPQEHKVKLNTAERMGIGLENLIDNTFRMRPDRVIVGEIRTKEEAKAFVNTMLAGQAKGSYATFHAESSKEAVERISSFGIEREGIKSVDIIVVQKRISKVLKNGKRNEERKITEICEIDKEDGSIKKLFYFDGKKLQKKENSLRVKNKIKEVYSITNKEFEGLLKEKKKLLEKIPPNILFREFFEFVEKEGR